MVIFLGTIYSEGQRFEVIIEAKRAHEDFYSVTVKEEMYKLYKKDEVWQAEGLPVDLCTRLGKLLPE